MTFPYLITRGAESTHPSFQHDSVLVSATFPVLHFALQRLETDITNVTSDWNRTHLEEGTTENDVIGVIALERHPIQ